MVSLTTLAVPAPHPWQGGLRLLCSASNGELEWLGMPWLPLTAAKFTHQLDRQSLCWEHGKGYAAVSHAGATIATLAPEARTCGVVFGREDAPAVVRTIKEHMRLFWVCSAWAYACV